MRFHRGITGIEYLPFNKLDDTHPEIDFRDDILQNKGGTPNEDGHLTNLVGASPLDAERHQLSPHPEKKPLRYCSQGVRFLVVYKLKNTISDVFKLQAIELRGKLCVAVECTGLTADHVHA